jgi:hypothetical protein
MAQPRLEAIRRRFWPKEGGRDVWAILDGARDNRIHSLLLNSYLDYSCLYSGPIPRELELAAPYLARLEQDDRVTVRLLEDGWGNSWSVFLKCDSAVQKLRRHLREFLLVRDPAGKRLVFRYYDPRVLRVYLPTCTPEELRTIFGPIQTFWVESEDPAAMLEFSLDGRKLVQNTIRVEPAPASQPS